MLKNKMRRLAPRPDFAESQANHGLTSEGGTTVQSDDLDCDHAPVFEIGNRCQDKVSHQRELNEPDRVNRFNSCEIQDDFCQNGKTRCHCDKTTVRAQNYDQNAPDDHHLTAKMSGQRSNHDKLSGKDHHIGPYDGASGHNVRLTDDNCHFDNEPDASSQAFVKMTQDGNATSAHEHGRSLNPTSYDGISSGPLPRSPLTPKTWQEAEKLAKMLCKAKLVPPGFESPDLCLLAILQGMEMGLPPMTALQRMALVDGKLTIWGDGALALVLKSGLCTAITEWMGLAGQDQEQKQKEFGDKEQLKDLTFDPHLQKREDEWVAFCEIRRAGWNRPIRRSFSSQDAKRANLWKKEGPWLDYPKRMLQMRARAFALRDAFADVLGGLYLREEMEAVKSSYSAPSRAVYLANSTPQRGIKNADRGNMRQNLAWNQTSKSEYQPDDRERKTQENQFISTKIPNNTHPPSYSLPVTDQAIAVHAKPQPVHGKYQIHGQNDLESPFGAKNQAQPAIKTNIDLMGHQPQTDWDDTVRSATPLSAQRGQKSRNTTNSSSSS